MKFTFRCSVCAAVIHLCFVITVGCFNVTSDADVAADKALHVAENTTHSFASVPAEVPSPVNDACAVYAVDPLTRNTVESLIDSKDKPALIEYRLNFVNYTFNPLTANSTWFYNSEKWSRVTTSHGQTLLSLAFNYGVLSMRTLTLGTQTLDVKIADSPPGCLANIANQQLRADVILGLLMRDFDGSSTSGPPTLADDERICHEIVTDDDGDGYAEFRDRCCFRDPTVAGPGSGGTSLAGVSCTTDIGNFWLTLLDALMIGIRFALIFFGPLLFVDVLAGQSSSIIPYAVKLKEPLVKTVFVCPPETDPYDGEKDTKLRFKHTVDLRSFSGRFPKLAESASQIPSCRPVRVKFQQYDIHVDYQRTLMENEVQVGIFQTLTRCVFDCHLQYVGPCKRCCKADMFSGCDSCPPPRLGHRFDGSGQSGQRQPLPWIWFWQNVARVLLVISIPLPYYIRVAVFNAYEYDEITKRKQAIENAGLKESFDHSILQYLTPSHPFFLSIYVIYFLTATLVVFASNRTREGRLKKMVFGSFRDLGSLDWVDTLNTVVGNLAWPFERFGVSGFLVGLIYWPLVVPLTIVVAVIYSVPTIYVTLRMIVYANDAFKSNKRRRIKIRKYQVNVGVDHSVNKFRVENWLNKFINRCCPSSVASRCVGDKKTVATDDVQLEVDTDVAVVKPPNLVKTLMSETKSAASTSTNGTKLRSHNWLRCVGYTVWVILCMLNLFSMVIILSEVIGCLVEIIVFTIMGVIVNAGVLLKYIMLIMMVFVHVFDCINSVEKKYLKLNKALFSEVKSRIRDLSVVTSLPSYLQENRGFKAQELNEQADYESPDDVAERPARHWMINDLVLFVDSEDTPRIPRQLFDMVCEIRVAGVPGPVYRGQVEALREVVKIAAFLCLVFIVVLSFSAVYKLSTTNQMLATVVGGFLPTILRTFVKSPPPDVELGTVSFRSKMDEVIANFCQYWPMCDLPFTQVVPETSNEAEPEVDEDDETNAKVDPALAATPKRQKSTDGQSVRKTSIHAIEPKSLASAFVWPGHLDPTVADDCGMSGIAMHQLHWGHGHERNNCNDLPSSYQPMNESACKRPEKFSTSTDRPPATPQKVTPVAPKIEKQVKIDEGSDGSQDVDILIYLPYNKIDPWLAEWSDFQPLSVGNLTTENTINSISSTT